MEGALGLKWLTRTGATHSRIHEGALGLLSPGALLSVLNFESEVADWCYTFLDPRRRSWSTLSRNYPHAARVSATAIRRSPPRHAGEVGSRLPLSQQSARHRLATRRVAALA